MNQEETPLMRHIKREAKKLKKAQPDMKLTSAQDLLAKNAGFADWKDLRDKELETLNKGGAE